MSDLSSFLLTLTVIASGGVLPACSNSPTAPTKPVTITLAPGQVQVVGGLSIRFVGVTRDNRCPGDALCVQAGDATVALATTLGPQWSAFELQLRSLAARSRVIGDYRVELTELAPYPFLSLPPIKPADYRVSLTVSAN